MTPILMAVAIIVLGAVALSVSMVLELGWLPRSWPLDVAWPRAWRREIGANGISRTVEEIRRAMNTIRESEDGGVYLLPDSQAPITVECYRRLNPRLGGASFPAC